MRRWFTLNLFSVVAAPIPSESSGRSETTPFPWFLSTSHFLSWHCDHMGAEFSAKHVSAHHKLIAFDRAVRARVGGGSPTATKLRIFAQHSYCKEDQIGLGRVRRDRSVEVCCRFNSPGGCGSTGTSCRYSGPVLNADGRPKVDHAQPKKPVY